MISAEEIKNIKVDVNMDAVNKATEVLEKELIWMASHGNKCFERDLSRLINPNLCTPEVNHIVNELIKSGFEVIHNYHFNYIIKW